MITWQVSSIRPIRPITAATTMRPTIGDPAATGGTVSTANSYLKAYKHVSKTLYRGTARQLTFKHSDPASPATGTPSDMCD